MEEQLTPLAVTHLLQHTLRSLCTHDNSQWVYAVFWRILPRNFPPPKWDCHGGAFDRSRGNRRNWILVWEDGFCNFAASTNAEINSSGDYSSSSGYGNCEFQQFQGLKPDVFFKMSHEIYNYGEGLIGKVAADHSHKWVYKEANEQEINFLSAWHNSADSYPRTWENQFQAGIKTIALIAVREGVVQLGAVNKVIEDLSYVVLLRKRLSFIESIPGVLLPHPSSSAFPYKAEGYGAPEMWHYQGAMGPPIEYGYHDTYNVVQPMMKITPSMSSLEALLSKLPSVVPTQSQQQRLPAVYGYDSEPQFLLTPNINNRPLEVLCPAEKVEKHGNEDQERVRENEVCGDSSSSMSSYPPHHHHHQQQQQEHQLQQPLHYHHHHHQQDLNVARKKT